jgi:hypothetical protein
MKFKKLFYKIYFYKKLINDHPLYITITPISKILNLEILLI